MNYYLTCHLGKVTKEKENEGDQVQEPTNYQGSRSNSCAADLAEVRH